MNKSLESHGGSVAQLAQNEAKVWDKSVYYDGAEKWTTLFWNPKGQFLRLFERLDLSCTLELACGHGRHSEHLLATYGDGIKRLYMTDILSSNVQHCMVRIGPNAITSFFINNGVDFHPIADNSLSAIFCYDAMVHFNKEVVRAYLNDAARVLKPGGKALFHHSNYSAKSTTPFHSNPQSRAYMSATLFREYGEEAKLIVLEQSIFPWGGVENLDALTLVQKPT